MFLRSFWDETRVIIHDQGVLMFALVVPLFYPLLYTWMYNNERMYEVPAAVVDDSHTAFSRDFIRRVDSTPDVEIAAHCVSMSEAEGLLAEGRVRGIIHIPSSFARDLWLGEQTKVGLHCSMASMLYYKGLSLGTTFVSLEMNREIQSQTYGKGTTERETSVAIQPVTYDYVPLFNPQSGFAGFIIPPVLMLILQQTLLLAIAISIAGRRERGCCLRSGSSLSGVAGLAGRSLPYLIIYMLMGVYAFTCVIPWFKLPSLGDYWVFIAFLAVFLCAVIAMSSCAGRLVRCREDAMLLFVPMSVPLLFLSGISWPGTNIPEPLRVVSYAFPSTFGLNAFARISTMGASLADVWPELRGLGIQTVVYGCLGWLIRR